MTTPTCICPSIDGNRIVRVGCPAHGRRDEQLAQARRETMTRLVADAASALSEVYDAAGVLIFWSTPVSYLSGRRPCDLYSTGDIDGMERLVRRARALADGARS